MIERFLWQMDPVLAISFFLLGLLWARFRWRVPAERVSYLEEQRGSVLKDLGRLREASGATQVAATDGASSDSSSAAITAFKRPEPTAGDQREGELGNSEVEAVVDKAEPPAEDQSISSGEKGGGVDMLKFGSSLSSEPEPEVASTSPADSATGGESSSDTADTSNLKKPEKEAKPDPTALIAAMGSASVAGLSGIAPKSTTEEPKVEDGDAKQTTRSRMVPKREDRGSSVIPQSPLREVEEPEAGAKPPALRMRSDGNDEKEKGVDTPELHETSSPSKQALSVEDDKTESKSSDSDKGDSAESSPTLKLARKTEEDKPEREEEKQAVVSSLKPMTEAPGDQTGKKENEPAASATPSDRAENDLTLIDGIDSSTQNALSQIGISSLQDLANLEEEGIQRLSSVLDITVDDITSQEWINQARRILGLEVVVESDDAGRAGDGNETSIERSAEEEQKSAHDTKPEQGEKNESSGAEVAPEKVSGTSGDDGADDLTAIEGVGPATEKLLNLMGISTYKQLASLTLAEQEELSLQLELEDRISEDAWVEQAQKLCGMDATSVAASPSGDLEAPDEASYAAVLTFFKSEPVSVDLELGVIYSEAPDHHDDLTLIAGIGEDTQRELQRCGIYCYRQMAHWNDYNIQEISRRLSYADRISREDWVKQAEGLQLVCPKHIF